MYELWDVGGVGALKSRTKARDEGRKEEEGEKEKEGQGRMRRRRTT